MKRVIITTLGCKVNQYESAAFHTGFAEAGFQVAPSGKDAELVVINSCAVTAKAGAQSRQAVRQALRANPAARIIITGCYAEIAAAELTAMQELAGREYSIIGNSNKDKLVANATNYDQELEHLLLGTIASAQEVCRLPVHHFGDRTRAYLRVQDGCESYCTYCIVPFTRGPSRSLPPTEVLQQARIFAEGGYREIVLTGIHLGHYGKDLQPATSITDLLDQLSLATPQVRYRISSLEPTEITEQLLHLMRSRQNIMPHLHIPLQSGDDEILARMNRHYTTATFANVLESCLKYLPDAAIGIDILAGFPGETDHHFQNTTRFIASLACTYLHVFPYSRRPGTAAADFDGEVRKQIKEQRVAELRELGEKKRELFYTAQLGRTLPVLVEGRRDKQGLLQGFSDNYVSVHFHGDDSLKNTVVDVQITEHAGQNVKGEVLASDEN